MALFPEHQDRVEEPIYVLYQDKRNLSPRIRVFLTSSGSLRTSAVERARLTVCLEF